MRRTRASIAAVLLVAASLAVAATAGCGGSSDDPPATAAASASATTAGTPAQRNAYEKALLAAFRPATTTSVELADKLRRTRSFAGAADALDKAGAAYRRAANRIKRVKSPPDAASVQAEITTGLQRLAADTQRARDAARAHDRDGMRAASRRIQRAALALQRSGRKFTKRGY